MNANQVMYRCVWRWHFYAGLLCLPIVLFLAVSGGLYLFKPQIESFRESSYMDLSVSDERQSVNDHIVAAQSAFPDALFHRYRIPKQDNDAVRVSVFSEDIRYFVYVNPYSLEIVDIVRFDRLFTELLKDLHESVFLGSIGSYFVELAACWAIVLFVTGIILWWPRDASGMAGVLYPRLSLEGRRFWKDLHVVIGFWISILALFLLISGLPWTQGWGGAFQKTRKVIESHVQQDWSTGAKKEHVHWHVNSVEKAEIDEIAYQKAVALNFDYPVMLSVDNAHHNSWKVSSQTQNRPRRADAWIDGYSGETLRSQAFSERKMVDKIIGYGIAAHEGQLFGWFNLALGVLTTLGLVLMSVSGFILWWKRKPQGALGAPKSTGQPIANTMIAVLVVSSLLLPLLLVSVVAIFLVEFVVLRHLPPARRWLGLAQ